MLRTLRLIAADVRQKATWCYGSASSPTLLKTLATDGTAAMVLYRLTQAARVHRLPVLEMVLNKATNLAGGCVIGRGADFGPGFVLIHSNGVVINGNVRGGSNVLIEHQVTIGADRRQTPVLGSDLFIGAGAKIVGGVTVGDGARIGANAVVVHDVAPNTTVVGIPAKPVQRREDRAAQAAAQASADGSNGSQG
ncbi:serine acetyltransferase [Sorangium sp. So ce315]|uniref:serine O-acetyltransferase n=1 Tax=Sorangium sp. So ce315 TaxID=3133299 RepID=UPI003F600CCC